MIWEQWWVWATAALGLAALELLAPGYVFLGFAIGAAATAVVVASDAPLSAWVAGNVAFTMVFFALSSLGAWIVLRLALGVRKGQVKVIEHDINED